MPNKKKIEIKLLKNNPDALVLHIEIRTKLIDKDLVSLAKKVLTFVKKNRKHQEQGLFAVIEPTIVENKKLSLRKLHKSWTSDEVRDYVRIFDQFYTISKQNKPLIRIHQMLRKTFGLLLKDPQKFFLTESVETALASIEKKLNTNT
jgi:aminoglycoside phosphotransferase family enzyme